MAATIIRRVFFLNWLSRQLASARDPRNCRRLSCHLAGANENRLGRYYIYVQLEQWAKQRKLVKLTCYLYAVIVIQRSDQPRGQKKSLKSSARCYVDANSAFYNTDGVRTASISCKAVTRMQGCSLRSSHLYILNNR